MNSILESLANSARNRVMESQKALSLEALKEAASAVVNPLGDFAFERALRKPNVSFICECKKASPSKGIIASDYPYVEIAMEYELAGADCISVLTEPTRFLGADEHLAEISKATSVPCLRKDFTVEEYMIYQAKLLGASAVLLICAILSEDHLSRFLALSDELGLTALVETRDESEIATALRLGARVIGVNNRNLKDFSVDMSVSLRLRELVGSEALFVAESGISSPEDVEKFRKIGVDAVLIGEALMRAADKKRTLGELRGGAE